MFLIYLEINSWKQIKRLEPEKLEELFQGTASIFNKGGGSPWSGHPRVYEFSSHFEESMSRILDTFFKVSDFIKDFEDILHGYSLILSDIDLNDSQGMKKLENLTYLIDMEGQLWLDQQCRKKWESYLNLESHGEIYRILARKQMGPLLPERKSIIQRDPYLEDLMERALAAKNGEKPSYHLISEDFQESLFSLEYWLEKQNFSNNILILDSPVDHRSYLPFFHSLHGDILNWTKEHNEPSSYWDMLEQMSGEQYMHLHRDCLIQDIENAYKLYLEQFMQYCRMKRIPAVCIVDRTRPWAAWAENILDWISFDWESTGAIIKLVLWTEIPKQLEKTSYYTLKRVNKGQAKELLNKAFPEPVIQKTVDPFLSSMEIFTRRELYAAGLLAEQGYLWENPEQGLKSLLDHLEPAQRRVLTLLSYGEQAVQRELLEACFQEDDGSRTSVSDYLDNLIHLGFIHRDRTGKYSLLWEELRNLLASDRKEDPEMKQLIKNYQQFEFQLWKQARTGDPYRLFQHLIDQGETSQWLDVLNSLIRWILDNQLFDEWEELLKHPLLVSREGLPELEVPLLNIWNAGWMRLYLMHYSDEEIEKQIGRGELSLVAAQGDYSDVFALQLSRYYLSCGDPSTALDYSKESLFDFQKKGNHLGEVYANTELALSQLAQKKISMALDYFDISRRIAQQLNNSHGLLMASSLEVVAIFLYGNLSLALRNADSLLELTAKEGRRDREFFLSFIKGRIYFELGNYEAAAEVFFELKTNSATLGFLPCSQASARWEARALIYLGRAHQAFGILSYQEDHRESLFFLAEADYLEKRYESALLKLDRALKQTERSRYNRSERVQWNDGFQAIEGWMYLSESEENILIDQLSAFRCLIMGLRGHYNEASSGLNRLIRSGDYPFRPYTHKYIYLLSQVNQGNSQVSDRGDDQLVLLSRAIEKLQSRAGRFDDQKMKLGYLNKNYWNKRIMEEAHKRKFI